MSNERILKKWKATGLLSGLDDNTSQKIALGLENEARWLVDQDSQDFAEVVVPLVRLFLDKIASSLEVAEMPAYLDKNGTPHVAETKYFSTKVSKNDLKNVTPEFVENLTNTLYDEIMGFKQNKDTVYLYTPIMFIKFDETNYNLGFRGNFI